MRHHFKPGSSHRRLFVVFAIASVLFLAVLGRIILLQTTESDALRQAGKAQRTTESVLKARRGTLFDRSGNELAISVPQRTLYANPRLVTDPQGTVSMLAALLGLSADKQQSLLASFTAKDKGFVYVDRQVDDELADAVMALDMPGISGYSEDSRMMPSGNVGRSVIGRTDVDGVGIAGLELQFNPLLAGVNGERVVEHDRDGRSIPGSGTTTHAAVAGEDVVLTLDRSLQYQVEKLLTQRVTDLLAKGGTAVVLDSSTGEIYAMANVERNEDGTVSVTSANLAAVGAYEPGSVAKVFSIAAAINEGVTTPDTTIDVPGKYVFDEDTQWEYTISDAEPHDTMPMTLRDIIVHSSNIGTLLTAGKMPVTTLAGYLTAFGFGQTTGLDFPNESAGIIKPVDKWQGSEKATVTYGYGYAATAIQLAAAVNTIANDGTYVAPKLVLSTIDAVGKVTPTEPSPTHQVVTPQTAAEMTAMMKDVVCDDKGTGKLARIDDISVAGKTGTSRKVQANGTYVGDDGEMSYTATFAGFLPADDPKVTILVSIDEPDPTSRDRFGGTAAAPLFAKIADAAIHELLITPPQGDQVCAAT